MNRWAPADDPDERLRDLEAEALRTGRRLAEHSEQLATIREQQRMAGRPSCPVWSGLDETGRRRVRDAMGQSLLRFAT